LRGNIVNHHRQQQTKQDQHQHGINMITVVKITKHHASQYLDYAVVIISYSEWVGWKNSINNIVCDDIMAKIGINYYY